MNINAISWLWAPSSSSSTKQVSFWLESLEDTNSGRISISDWLVLSSSDWLRKKFSSFKISVIELQPKTIDVCMATSMRNKMTFLRDGIVKNPLLWTRIHHFSYKKTPCPRNFHFRFSNSPRLSVLDGSHLSDVKFSGVMIQGIFSLWLLRIISNYFESIIRYSWRVVFMKVFYDKCSEMEPSDILT